MELFNGINNVEVDIRGEGTMNGVLEEIGKAINILTGNHGCISGSDLLGDNVRIIGHNIRENGRIQIASKYRILIDTGKPKAKYYRFADIDYIVFNYQSLKEELAMKKKRAKPKEAAHSKRINLTDVDNADIIRALLRTEGFGDYAGWFIDIYAHKCYPFRSGRVVDIRDGFIELHHGEVNTNTTTSIDNIRSIDIYYKESSQSSDPEQPGMQDPHKHKHTAEEVTVFGNATEATEDSERTVTLCGKYQLNENSDNVNVYVGWAVCHPLDEFDWNLAKEISSNRVRSRNPVGIIRILRRGRSDEELRDDVHRMLEKMAEFELESKSLWEH